MKKQYSISFFAAMLLMVLMLAAAYRSEYKHLHAQLEAEQNQKEETMPTMPTEGTVEKSDVFFLRESNGFVTVYLKDNKTVYEYTSIRVDNLPEEVAAKIRQGMKIESTERLYSFLEGYSS